MLCSSSIKTEGAIEAVKEKVADVFSRDDEHKDEDDDEDEDRSSSGRRQSEPAKEKYIQPASRVIQ